MALLQSNPPALLRSIAAVAPQAPPSPGRLDEVANAPKRMRRREAMALSLLSSATQVALGGGAALAAAAEAAAEQQQQIEQEQGRRQQECEFKLMESGLGICDLVVGTGKAPLKGNVIRLHYTGAMEDGVVFDSSYNRGEPFTFQLNSAGVMKGIYRAILGSGDDFPPMLPGGKRRVRVPPELGFGNNPGMCPRFWSGPCQVPPNSVLVYNLEYLGLWTFEDDTRPFHMFT